MTPPIQDQVALVTGANTGVKTRDFGRIANVASLGANTGGLQFD